MKRYTNRETKEEAQLHCRGFTWTLEFPAEPEKKEALGQIQPGAPEIFYILRKPRNWGPDADIRD